MPSPIGHALAGIAAGWIIAPSELRDRAAWGRAAAFAAAGVAADLDLLLGTHSGPTHGLGAAMIGGALAWTCMRLARIGAKQRLALAAGIAMAYASHTLLDWLGTDNSPPIGIMALWPLSHGYYESRVHAFMAISRRYWLREFWTYNLLALARELAILLPIVGMVLYFRRAPRQIRAGSKDPAVQ